MFHDLTPFHSLTLSRPPSLFPSQVGGLEGGVSEEGLRYLFTALVPVLDVRLVRDKFTGAPRGFAFVEFGSVPDAARALNALQVGCACEEF